MNCDKLKVKFENQIGRWKRFSNSKSPEEIGKALDDFNKLVDELESKLMKMCAARDCLKGDYYKLMQVAKNAVEWGCIARLPDDHGLQCYETKIGFDAWCPSCQAHAVIKPEGIPAQVREKEILDGRED